MIMGRKKTGIWPRLTALLAMTALLVMEFTGGMAIPVHAAENNDTTANVIHVEKTVGTVKVLGSTGKEMPLRQNMNLYNGSRVDTRERSYAWIGLDRTKLLKMDAYSRAGVRKSGKKLAVLLESGKIFFNVAKPLESDESLYIRTSTMAIGIRGTSGWAEILNEYTARVSILEGTVEVTVTEPVTGEVRTETVRGGESVRCVVYGNENQGGGDKRCDILRKELTEEDVWGFVLEEVAPDDTLCTKIYEKSGLDLRTLSKTPAERLREDETEARKKMGEIEKLLREQEGKSAASMAWAGNDPDTPGSSGSAGSPGGSGSSGSWGGSGGTSHPGGSNNPGGTATPAPTETVTLTLPVTAKQLNAELQKPQTKQVTVAKKAAGDRMTLDGAVSVPAGKILDVQAETDIPAGTALGVENGAYLNAAGITNAGVLDNKGTVQGTEPAVLPRSVYKARAGGSFLPVEITNSNSITNSGTIYGSLTVDGVKAFLTNAGTINGTVTLGAGSVNFINMNGGKIDGGAGSALVLNGVGNNVALIADSVLTSQSSEGTVQYTGSETFTGRGGIIQNEKADGAPALKNKAGSAFVPDWLDRIISTGTVIRAKTATVVFPALAGYGVVQSDGWYCLKKGGSMTDPGGSEIDPGGSETDPDAPVIDPDAPEEPAGDFTVKGGMSGTDYSYDAAGKELKILTGTLLSITNTDLETSDTIRVMYGVTADIILAGVNINVSNTGDDSARTKGRAALLLEGGADVRITLEGGTENILKSGYQRAGIEKNGASRLTITGNSADNPGKLTVTGGETGAGIGGGYGENGRNITFRGGTVAATGGENGAGIGGGAGGSGTDITIIGGSLEVHGIIGGAGIGGGAGGIGGVGIGGESGCIGENIIISGGKVKAWSGYGGAGIGGGSGYSGTNITISGGEVTATGGSNGAGIGGGNNGNGENITISGGKVSATGVDKGAGIGGGSSGNGDNITISGGEVTVTGGTNGTGIGGGISAFTGSGLTCKPATNVTITGDTTKIISQGWNRNAVCLDLSTAHLLGGTVENTKEGSALLWKNAPPVGTVFRTLFKAEDQNPIARECGVSGNDNAVPAGYDLVEAEGNTGWYCLKKRTVAADAPEDTAGAFTVKGGTKGTDYSYEDNALKIKTATPLSIRNTNPNTATTDTITVEDGVTADIILAGVNIDVSGTGNYSNSTKGRSALLLAGNADAYIMLADNTENILKSGAKCAGLEKNGTGKLIITSDSIDNSGVLTATGGEGGAGIGSSEYYVYSDLAIGSAANIIIDGGTIAANGGKYGAGIGGGFGGNGIGITISGGKVTATGGEYGAGIGGGNARGNGSNITINSGSVEANGGKYGAGIGGGDVGNGDNITINGGIVKAGGGYSGAGIGGGNNRNGTNIMIRSGTVTANGGEYGAGIGGGGFGGNGEGITISGGNVTATGGEYGAGIGGGTEGNGNNIKIIGGEVRVDPVF